MFQTQNLNKLDIRLKTKVENEKSSYYPLQVIDRSDSITSGWMLMYSPKPTKNHTLFDAKETFTKLYISNFDAWRKTIMSYDQTFQNEPSKDTLYNDPFKVYETDLYRVTCYQKQKTTVIKFLITDSTSPFYFLSAKFIVTDSKKDIENDKPKRIIIGEDNQSILRNNIFAVDEAFFGPQKTRMIKADNDESKYIVTINNRYQAAAYISESYLFEYIMNHATQSWLQTEDSKQHVSKTNQTKKNDFFDSINQASEQVIDTLKRMEESLVF